MAQGSCTIAAAKELVKAGGSHAASCLVHGRVTTVPGILKSSPIDFYIQDETSGILVIGGDLVLLHLGDQVQVVGRMINDGLRTYIQRLTCPPKYQLHSRQKTTKEILRGSPTNHARVSDVKHSFPSGTSIVARHESMSCRNSAGEWRPAKDGTLAGARWHGETEKLSLGA